jgi:hypothetical protein
MFIIISNYKAGTAKSIVCITQVDQQPVLSYGQVEIFKIYIYEQVIVKI